MIVKNYHGSARWAYPSCGCTSWIEHWSLNAFLNNYGCCSACGTYVGDVNLVGGHVIKKASTDSNLYIVPICRTCNADPDLEFDVREGLLVLAEASTCKRNRIV